MKKYVITWTVLIGVALVSTFVTYAQFWSSTATAVVYFTKGDTDILYKSLPDKNTNTDQCAFITDLGPYNLGLNVQHRIAPETRGPQGGIRFHAYESEIYYIVSGNGILVTQTGAMTNVHPGDYSHEETWKRLTDEKLGFNAPSGWADFSDPPVSHKVGPGDWVVIPPFTGHYLSEINDHLDYVVLRVDPYHSMPTGYINPAFRKMGIKTLAVH